MNQARPRFVDRVSYITCPGHKVKTLVTDSGIFEKIGDDNELTLTGCLTNPERPALEDRIKAVREKCGWPLKVSSSVKDIPRPGRDALVVLRALDPRGYFRI
jgi:acyl CoA:acetate/3-ketoacid CoA transferase beta subunit